jgi:[protein-PII] uridylyltransferase
VESTGSLLAASAIEELRALDQQPLGGASGGSVARRRSDVIDQLVRGLFEPVAVEGLAVAALGGYGRRELTPASDIDLIFLYRRKDRTAAERTSAALLYPLWDAGLQVSHSVRTFQECRAEARDRLESLTALLSIRPIGGSIELVTGAWQEARSVARKWRSGFAADLERSRQDRGFRYGSVQRSLEPELKESLGGYRDLQLLGWINSALFQDDAVGPGHDSADLGELVAAELLSPLEANHLR